ncbi:helix-turn-helix domain-containing protein [Streptomyces kronopolitis]|uniref:helix-turn-helix domain-containing protein n=1 Tax=Streptomyces kronopolitis TaxID=1612435 RepID=UPI003F57F76A
MSSRVGAARGCCFDHGGLEGLARTLAAWSSLLPDVESSGAGGVWPEVHSRPAGYKTGVSVRALAAKADHSYNWVHRLLADAGDLPPERRREERELGIVARSPNVSTSRETARTEVPDEGGPPVSTVSATRSAIQSNVPSTG